MAFNIPRFITATPGYQSADIDKLATAVRSSQGQATELWAAQYGPNAMVDFFDREDGVVANGWRDWNTVMPNTGAPGTGFDPAWVKRGKLGWDTCSEGRVAIDRDMKIADNFEISLTLPTDIEEALPNYLTIYNQPGPMICSSTGIDPNQDNGLSFAPDITTTMAAANCVDGIQRQGAYLWSNMTDPPNYTAQNVRVYDFAWPAQGDFFSVHNVPCTLTMRVRNGMVECRMRGERIMGPTTLPTPYVGRTRHGMLMVQGFNATTWPQFVNLGQYRPWTFKPFDGTLAAAPVTPTVGPASAFTKGASGTVTTVSPLWPSDVSAGATVIVVVGKSSPASSTPPVIAGHTWYAGVQGGVAAGMRFDTFQTIANGTETPGAPIGAFTWANTGGVVATAFCVKNCHPGIRVIGGSRVGTASTTITGVSQNQQGREFKNIWIAMMNGATMTPPAGYATVVNTGIGGVTTMNLCIAEKTENLPPNTTIQAYGSHHYDGTANISAVAVTGQMSAYPDPR